MPSPAEAGEPGGFLFHEIRSASAAASPRRRTKFEPCCLNFERPLRSQMTDAVVV